MDSKGIVETMKDSFLDLVDGAIEFLPKLLVAILLLLVGMLIARLVSKLIGKAVDLFENSKPVKKTLQSVGVKSIDIDGIVSLFIRWSIILVFLSAAIDVLELRALSDTFNSLVAFVPNILAAVAVAGLTLFAANAIYDIVLASAKKAHITAHRALANISRVVVLIFGLPLAASQLGMDLTIITDNLTVIVAGIMLAFGLSFGLGGQKIAAKIVEDMYKNWKK